MQDSYHNSEGISRSRLFYISKSPEYFKFMEDNPGSKADREISGMDGHNPAVMELDARSV